ncbi:MAG: hypothetical protein ACOY17_00660 [Pseudomonadota bacterium]
MSWKTEFRLADMDARDRIEITCRKCGHTHYETVAPLLARPGMRHLYLDEVERALVCANRFCRAPLVRIALVHDGKTEGFTGGLA